MKKINISKNLKRIMFVGGLSLSTVSLTGCINTFDNMVPFVNILDEVEEKTNVDEVLEDSSNSDILDKFGLLEKCLSLSEKLHSIDYNKHQVLTDSKVIDDISIQDFKNIENDIVMLQSLTSSSPEYNKICKQLNESENRINNWLNKYGYQTATKMGTLVVQAKLTDALNLDASEYKNFEILINPEDYPNMSVKYIKPQTGQEYYYYIKSNTLENAELAKTIYYAVYESKLNDKKTVTDNYDEYRNDSLYTASEYIKRLMFATYSHNDSAINQCNSKSNIENKYDKKRKALK